MASEITVGRPTGMAGERAGEQDLTVGRVLRTLVAPVASLKLTVALFAMAIFLIFAGTLAQVDKDIWQVIKEYFRTPLAWIDWQIFFPVSFFPSKPQVAGGFYFPGGWSIGGLMAVNLLAAHGLRFRPQARGARLWAGVGVIVFGALITWMAIASGSNKEGLQGAPLWSWSTLWELFRVGLGAIWLATLFAALKTDRQQKAQRWLLLALLLAIGGLLAWLVASGDSARFNDSSMRILWQLMKAEFAAIVLLVGAAMVFRKRGPIVLLHAGVGLMMFNELFVGLTAVEEQMQIAEGETVSYAQDIRTLELAIIDRSHAARDDVVVIPESVLLEGGVIRHRDLPFNVALVKFYKNSSLAHRKPADDNPATKGTGLEWTPVEERPGAGADSGGAVDLSSALVKFMTKNGSRDLGTYLVSLIAAAQDIPEKVAAGEKTYDVHLRFKRTYKPYSVRLIDVRKDDYLGTDTPRNYSSDVQLVDQTRHVDQKVHIWMNNPLRFAGETFYQSNYARDPRSGKEITTLSVVTNAGWMIPYVGCMIVVTGLLAHFCMILVRFLNRQAAVMGKVPPVVRQAPIPRPAARNERRVFAADVAAVEGDEDRWLTVFGWWLPVGIVCLAAAMVAFAAWPRETPAGKMKLDEFGKLPLVYEGRVKPIDTLARNGLLVLSGRQTFHDKQGHRQPATRWLIDVIAKPEDALHHRVFKIDNLELLDTLGLKRRKHYRYAFAEFGKKLDELGRQAALARGLDAADLSTYQKKVLELENKIGVLDLLFQSFSPPQIRMDHAKEDFIAAVRQQHALASRHPPLVVPPMTSDEKWDTYAMAWIKDIVHHSTPQGERNPAVASLTKIFAAYGEGDVPSFNHEVARYQASIEADPPPEMSVTKINFEAFFNRFSPFLIAAFAYLFAFVIAAFGWLIRMRPLNRAAFWLIAFTLGLHTFALLGRIYISGRPSVTNLYSSAVFIGFACVMIGLVVEAVFRLGLGNLIASVAGSATLGIAHYLAREGDTFVVLQAVLDTQFWLFTHVQCVTLGYAATYATGLFGVLFVLLGVLTPSLSANVSRELARMIYGALCFALFFSFLGTVLGGLWADDSWGRFWGWDPKENGALMIVLWNALVLHARWDGLVKERGLAVLAIGGNIFTSWSWFGVNELGVGLHSYGFTEGVLMALGVFVASQLVIVALGSLPLRYWWSYRRRQNEVVEAVVVA